MDVAAGAGIGRVHVGVRVDPDQAYWLLLLAEAAREARYGADRYRMVAAQHERDLALGGGFFYGQAQAPARFGYLRKIPGLRGAFRGCFALVDREVALVFHLVAELG